MHTFEEIKVSNSFISLLFLFVLCVNLIYLGGKGMKDKKRKWKFDFKFFFIIIVNLYGSYCHLSYIKRKFL